MMAVVRDVQVTTPSGLVIGHAKGFDLDTPMFDQFFSRVCRGLIHDVLGDADLVELDFEWRMLDDRDQLKGTIQSLPVNPHFRRIGTEFEFIGFCVRSDWPSLWIMQFYQGPVFMVFATPKSIDNQ
jgi:hypothetical protein